MIAEFKTIWELQKAFPNVNKIVTLAVYRRVGPSVC